MKIKMDREEFAKSLTHVWEMMDYAKKVTEISEPLTMLAKRKNVDYENWFNSDLPNSIESYKCFICEQLIVHNTKFVYEHGIEHLKEHNLLSII